ncbi:MAG: surface lipoprotein assembly modifier [Pseudomonadota bacterium]
MKKYSSLIILIFVLLFENISFGAPLNNDEDLDKGIRLFQSGQYTASYNLLLDIFEQDPENIELNFYLGRAAFEIKQYEMAIMAYERILIASPFENRVKLELARSFHAIGANNTARQYCRDVMATNPPDAVTKNIKAFLAVIDKSEQTHFLKGQVAFGVAWNNNVWASPTTGHIGTVIGDITLTGPSAKKNQDWVYNTTLSLDHTYQDVYSNYVWKTDAIVYNSIYNQTSALDLRFIGTVTGPEWISGKERKGLKIILKQIELGNEAYMSSMGVKTSLDYIVSPAILARTGGQFELKRFKDNTAQNAHNKSVFVDLSFSGGTYQCGLGLRVEKERALDDEYSYTRVQSMLSVSKTFWFKIKGSAGYRYQFSKYDEAAALFIKEREDHQNSVGLSLGKTLWQSAVNPGRTIKMNLDYQHIWNFSNIDLYEYRQDIAQVSVAYTF